MRKARNVMVLKYGGLTKRPGTHLVGEVFDTLGDNRLVPFQFSLTQTYAIEMGQAYMAPMTEGGRIVEDELAITGITNAPNAAITAAYHAYVAENRVFLNGINGALGEQLNGRIAKVVQVIDDNTFSINIDTSAMPAFTGATGGITRTVTPDPPPPPPVVPPVVEPPTRPVVIKPGEPFRPDYGVD
ncbi:hypothetical protein [Novosphingobium sp. Leaf2]|uniref:hypothetical protein n=1 Tax=Novosphingobium sp. Leaf2 TaxID=1735670 RepID=UPI001F238E73|nr:hypothetical protein [Novosphingobium sp. Leaf2]